MNRLNVEVAGVEGGRIQPGGPVGAMLLANGMRPEMMRPFLDSQGRPCVSVLGADGKYRAQPMMIGNAVLQKDEWKAMDTAVMRVRRERLVGIDDLVSRGLTYTLSNPMGTTVLEHEVMTDSGVAQMDMDAVNRAPNDRPAFSLDFLPIPIVHSDFQFNARVLAASRMRGDSLDTTQAENATRRVNEKLEDLLFTNISYKFGGGSIYSYVNHPDRMLSNITSWTASGKTGADIVADVLAWKEQMLTAKFYGPWVIYVPTGYETVLDGDYALNYTKTVRQRILEIGGIQDIKVADHLAADNVVMVQMSSDVVRLVEGMAPTPIQWETEGGMVLNFKILTIRVPQIRSVNGGDTGIVHAS